MASPQCENGYTEIAHEILQQLALQSLNGTQFRILLVVFRYTYGFHRKEHELSESFLAKATGIHKQQIKRELGGLILKKILTVMREATFNSSRVIAFNKNYEEWVAKQIGDQVAKKIPGSEIDTTTGSGLDTSPGSGLDTQEIYSLNIKTKDNILSPEKENTALTTVSNSQTTETRCLVEMSELADSAVSLPGFPLPTLNSITEPPKIEPSEKIILKPDEAEFIAVLESVKGYPLDRQKDLECYHLLTARYPQLDLIGAVKDWAIYKIGKPLKPKDNPRSQINNWCKKAVEWKKNLKATGPPGRTPFGQPDKWEGFTL